MVERLIADESFRVVRSTEMVWDSLVKDLPYDFTDQCASRSAILLEDVVRTDLWNGLCPDQTDYVGMWAEEMLYDVDFNELAIRLGASPYA